jgi:hypothetical protein
MIGRCRRFNDNEVFSKSDMTRANQSSTAPKAQKKEMDIYDTSPFDVIA